MPGIYGLSDGANIVKSLQTAKFIVTFIKTGLLMGFHRNFYTFAPYSKDLYYIMIYHKLTYQLAYNRLWTDS